VYSELAREKMWARIYLTPLLQAEEDRDAVRRHFARQTMEKELLGKEHPVYHGDRYVAQAKTPWQADTNDFATDLFVQHTLSYRKQYRNRVRRRTIIVNS
jgi:hypothetical protein